MTRAFVYKWTHLPTGKWYIGSRTAKNCHPDDGYICSSKIVKKLIDLARHEWVRNIIVIGNPKDMFDVETKLLRLYDASKDPKSFNQHNNNKNFIRCQKKPWNVGFPMSEDSKRKLSLSKKGKPSKNRGYKFGPPSDEARRKMSLAKMGNTPGNKGRKLGPRSEEIRQKISNSSKGKIRSPISIAKHKATCARKKMLKAILKGDTSWQA